MRHKVNVYDHIKEHAKELFSNQFGVKKFVSQVASMNNNNTGAPSSMSNSKYGQFQEDASNPQLAANMMSREE